MFRPIRPSSGLQSSKKLNIVCVWRMLRSHHVANKLYMRHKLCVSRYGGERALTAVPAHTLTAIPAHTQFMSHI